MQIFNVTDEVLRELIDVTSKLKSIKSELIELLPDEFKTDFEQESYISGGCIYSLYNNETPKDYDFFLKSDKLVRELREYFIDVAGYKGSKVSGGLYKNLPLVITENAISIGKYQIITRWIGKPEDVVSQFDFKHLMVYFDNDKIHTLVEFQDLNTKELKYNTKRARDIVGSVFRSNKFVQRGMSIEHKEMAKILLKLHEVGFSDQELELLRDSSSDDHFGS